jgi:hypothetical protein
MAAAMRAASAQRAQQAEWQPHSRKSHIDPRMSLNQLLVDLFANLQTGGQGCHTSAAEARDFRTLRPLLHTHDMQKLCKSF